MSLAAEESGVGAASRDAARPTATTAWGAVMVLILAAPFEPLQPLLQMSWQAVSLLEATLLAVLVVWLGVAVRTGEVPVWHTPLTWPWLAVLAAMLAAAVAAPVARGNALNMVGRIGIAFVVYVLTVNAVTSPARLRGVLLASGAAAIAVSTLVMLEYVGAEGAIEWLGAFRERVALVGDQVRASGPFQYPTIASMYLEIVFALLLGLLLVTLDEGRRAGAALVALVLAFVGEAIVFTFTRAGLITMATSLLIVAGLRLRARGLDRGVLAVAIVALVVGVEVLGSRSVEALRLRLTTEGIDSWYRARIEAPPRLSLQAGSAATVAVTVTNVGRSAWDSSSPQPFRLSYHWLQHDEDQVVSWEGLRTDFPEPVAPGAQVSLAARVLAPGDPGEYRLLWDIEQERRLWFSLEPDAVLSFSRVAVRGPAVSAGAPIRRMPLPRRAARPGRRELWRAALRMVADRPLTGVGPDNFRLRYGEYAGVPHFDPRVHANNTYLEVLATGGLAGGLAFAWFCWRTAGQAALAARRVAEPPMMAAAGVAAAGAAIALHALVDSFVGFTGTYVLMAISLGLIVASGRMRGTDARRV